jgi:hypothetical protein
MEISNITFNNRKICALSNLCGKYDELLMPDDMDILVCVGNMCNGNKETQIQNFYNWISKQKSHYKIIVTDGLILPKNLFQDRYTIIINDFAEFTTDYGIVMFGLRFYITHDENQPFNYHIYATDDCADCIINSEGDLNCDVMRSIFKTKFNSRFYDDCPKYGGQKRNLIKKQFYDVASNRLKNTFLLCKRRDSAIVTDYTCNTKEAIYLDYVKTGVILDKRIKKFNEQLEKVITNELDMNKVNMIITSTPKAQGILKELTDKHNIPITVEPQLCDASFHLDTILKIESITVISEKGFNVNYTVNKINPEQTVNSL